MANKNGKLARIVRDQRGGVAIVFALTVMALMMVCGAAIDFARSFSSLEALQQDLDAAVLFAGTERMRQGDDFDPQAGVQTYLDGLIREQQVTGAVVATVNQPTSDRIQAVARAKVPSKILRIFGFDTFDITASSEASLGQQPVEVALVLDNTGSMSGGKLTALQDAAKSLVEIAYQAPKADKHVKISIVPFSQYVNVGLSNRNKSWISVPADSTTTGPQVCEMVSPVTGTSNCHDVTSTYLNDGVPTTYTQQTCDYTYGPPVNQCYTPTSTTTWNGCVGSRNYPLDTLDEQYTTKIVGLPNTSCPSEITALTNDKSLLNSQISNMVASGETYIPAGLMWGWRVLSKDAPYDQAKGYGELVNGQPTTKLMVLMTDGQNTLSPTYPAHDGNDTVLANKLTAEVCTNIKAKGIQIYTVAFAVTDANIKSILQSCASGPGKYFDAGNAEQLKTSFNEIAKDFSPLHLTR
jgi:Mg-chelatase subunit ChlD